MARIPTEDELGEPVIGPGRAMVNLDGADRSNMLDTARSTMAMGKGLGDVASGASAAIGAWQDKSDDYEVTKALIEFDGTQQRLYDEARRSMPEGAAGFADGYRERYDTAARELVARGKDGGWSNASLKKLDGKLHAWGEQLHTKAWNDELDERDRFRTADVERQILDLQNRVAEKPERAGEHVAAARALINTANLSLAKKSALSRKVPALVEEVAARSIMERDPERAIRMLLQRPRGDTSGPPAYSQKGDQANQKTIAETAAELGEDAAHYLTMADIETAQTFKTGSRNSRSSAAGLYHFLDENRRWAAANGTPYGDDAVSQTKAMAAKAASDRRVFETAADREPEPWEEYILHYQGAPMGTRLLLASGQTDLRTALGARTDDILKANPNLEKFRTVGEFRDHYRDLYSRRRQQFESAGPPADSGDVDTPELESDRWQEADAPAFRHLPYLKRQTLLRVARTAMRAEVDQSVNDDIERVRDGRRPSLDDKGRTSLDRARLVMTQNQVRKLEQKWSEAEHEAKVVLPLDNMSEADVDAHLSRYDPGDDTGTESYRTADKVYTKAVQRWNKIEEARRKDFALAVEATPEVKSARDFLRRERAKVVASDGVEVAETEGRMATLAPARAWEMLIEARYTAQRRLLGYPEGDTSQDYRLRPITKREAERLLDMPDPSSIDEREFANRLKSAADRAEQQYGPTHSRRVFEAAVAYWISGKEQSEQARDVARSYWRDAANAEKARLLARQAMGGVVTQEDERQARAVNETIMAERALAAERVAQMPQGSRLDTFSRTARKPPNEKQRQWLRDNPTAWDVFDERFGRGAAAAVLKDANQAK
jgi:hypothetical protein